MKIISISGSKSDSNVVEKIEYDCEKIILSAHRDFDKLDAYLDETHDACNCYIGVAGLAAHLPGVIAAKTRKITIGIPVKKNFEGIDALLSMLQMPSSTPVITVAPEDVESVNSFLKDINKFIEQLKTNYLKGNVETIDIKIVHNIDLHKKKKIRILETYVDELSNQKSEINIEKDFSAKIRIERDSEIISSNYKDDYVKIVIQSKLEINIPLMLEEEFSHLQGITCLSQLINDVRGVWIGVNNFKNIYYFLERLLANVIIYRGSVKDVISAGNDKEKKLLFHYSDRYSVFDWKEMPDEIPLKGVSMASIARKIFKHLENKGIKTHFIENNGISSFDYNSSKAILVEQFEVIRPITKRALTKKSEAGYSNNDNDYNFVKYDYKNYKQLFNQPGQYLLPLEIIFRFSLTKTSSLLKKLNDVDYLKDLGVTKEVLQHGEPFSAPLIEFTTKLENMDRSLTYNEAQEIAGLNSQVFMQLIDLSRKIAYFLKEYFLIKNIELIDGKIELGLKITNDVVFGANVLKRELVLVDSLGPDELRLSYNDKINSKNNNFSKELLRSFYYKSIWYQNLEKCKKNADGTYNHNWKSIMKRDLQSFPDKLSFGEIESASKIYTDLEKILSDTSTDNEYQSDQNYFAEINHLKNQNVLILGNGGREDALAWKIALSPIVQHVFVMPGNPAMSRFKKVHHIGLPDDINITERSLYDENFNELAKKFNSYVYEIIKNRNINLVIVGPEIYLASGIVDYLEERQTLVFGPNLAAAQVELSKDFAKGILKEEIIVTPQSNSFHTFESTMKHIEEVESQRNVKRLESYSNGYVVKADGVCSGKGVFICDSKQDLIDAANYLFNEKQQKLILLEEKIIGDEISSFYFCDGAEYRHIGNAQDYKRLYEGNQGPNCGGMGAIADFPNVNIDRIIRLNKCISETIVSPFLNALKKKGIHYKGVLFVGGMILSNDVVSVIEFNARFGDPETQALLPLIDEDLFKWIFAVAQGRLADTPKRQMKLKSNSIAVHVVLASSDYCTNNSKNDCCDDIVKLPLELLDLSCSPDSSTLLFMGNVSAVCGDTSIESSNFRIFSKQGRVLGITAIDSKLCDAAQRAQYFAERIIFNGKHFRRDIGCLSK